MYDSWGSDVEPLEQQLDAAYETFQQEHEYERELAEAVDEAADRGLRVRRRVIDS